MHPHLCLHFELSIEKICVCDVAQSTNLIKFQSFSTDKIAKALQQNFKIQNFPFSDD
jgi:hypothetical protein